MEIKVLTTILTHWVAAAIGALIGVLLTLFMIGTIYIDDDDEFNG